LLTGLVLALAFPARAAADRYEVRVDGLACPFCAYGLEKKLEALDGLAGLDIDLDQGLVSFEVTAGEAITPGEIAGAVREAGFSPRSMTLTLTGTLKGSAEHPLLDLGSSGKSPLTLRGPLSGAHPGQRVQVQGTARPEGDRWIVEVRSLEALEPTS
jgi:mercuric ion binding protein